MVEISRVTDPDLGDNNEEHWDSDGNSHRRSGREGFRHIRVSNCDLSLVAERNIALLILFYLRKFWIVQSEPVSRCVDETETDD